MLKNLDQIFLSCCCERFEYEYEDLKRGFNGIRFCRPKHDLVNSSH